MFKKRKIIQEIEKWLPKQEIIILLWPRQVGKTTLLKYFFDKISWQKLWFDLDKPSHCSIFSSYEKLIQYLQLQKFDLKQKITLFVDEFQYCKNAERVFKNLYDSFDNIKILASGSSSLNIKNLIQESLAWRKKILKVYPLNIEEFISWKTGQDFDIAIFKDIKVLKDIGKEYLTYLYEFMVWGGYPKVVLDKSLAKEHLENIFDLYLKKDIVDLLNIKHLESFKKLITYLALNSWNQINYSQLANFADIDIWTVKNYIEILEETFLVKKVIPFYTNKNKEISKASKVYFVDNGVRNYFIKNFLEEVDLRQDAGILFESIVMQEFLKHNVENIKYRRTKTKQEVDFIIDNIQVVDAIEVKFKEKVSAKDFAWLKTFSQLYSKMIKNLYLISKYGLEGCLEDFKCENLYSFLAGYFGWW